MARKLSIILVTGSILWPFLAARAQFNTITDTRGKNYEIINRPSKVAQVSETQQDTIVNIIEKDESEISIDRRETGASKVGYTRVRKKHLDFDYHYEVFPDLTLNNLRKEIRKNGIKYENVVLAQAILETGWFTSSVCRNKKNLFGLTNPRTGDYYEFERWQDSVKAYYTKVQYKYKGGNYLLWLDRLPYATKTTYISSLITLLKQYFI